MERAWPTPSPLRAALGLGNSTEREAGLLGHPAEVSLWLSWMGDWDSLVEMMSVTPGSDRPVLDLIFTLRASDSSLD